MPSSLKRLKEERSKAIDESVRRNPDRTLLQAFDGFPWQQLQDQVVKARQSLDEGGASVAEDIQTIAKRLAEPFPAADIEWRVGSTDNKDNPTKGIALAYMTNRAVQQRLDDVVGIGNWQNKFEMWRNNGVLCGLSLRINGEWITKWDGSDESDMEAIKGGFSDAMKRAAYQWGIGRYLYDLPTVWVPVEKRGKTTYLKSEPQLPDWALPENERGKQKPSTHTQPQQHTPQKPNEETPKKIGDTERGVLWNAAKAKGWTADQYKAHLVKEGFAASTEVTADKYPTLLHFFKNNEPPKEGN